MKQNLKTKKERIINLTGSDDVLPVQGKKIYLPTNRDDIIPTTPDIVKGLDIDNFSIPLPPGKTLLPFQDPAIRSMLRFYKDLDMKGVYNGYSPGLGKSLMSIVVASNILKSKRILVVCPSGVRGTFEEEIRKWDIDSLPTIHTLYTSRGAIRPITAKWCIVSYQLLLKKNVFERLYEVPWNFIIFDEAKSLKSIGAKQTILARELWNRAKRGMWMDGTPMTRSAEDLFSPCSALMPETFISQDEFCEEYCLKRSVPWGFRNWEYFGGKNLEKLRDIIRANFFVRKTKEEVLQDLPEATHQKIALECGPFDKKLTDAQEQFILDSVREGRDPNTCAKPEDKKHISERRIEAGMKCVQHGKDFIGEFLDADVPIVVIAYHRVVIDSLMEIFNKFNPVKIDGSVTGAAKDRARDAFNDGRTNIIILQITAAQGINLQKRSSTVIFVECSFSPSEVEQARDRVRRIGQKNAVNCYFLLPRGSVYEEVFKILKAKLEIIEKVIVSTD